MKQITEPAILSTAYFPNIQYVSKLILHKKVIIDIHETYLKQSFRNRFQIDSANGLLDLSIPIIKPYGNRTKTKDIQIEYVTGWMQVHWRAIVSAYSNSPFFEIFEAELAPLYELKEKYLIDFNIKVLTQLFHSLDLDFNFEYSEAFIKPGDSSYDSRNSISPKKRLQVPDPTFSPKEYYQVFKVKNGFMPNLSFLDLMLNEGPESISLLRNSII